ncbi:hypothetical protein FOA52_007957 [Chlamydomonas sp. UWO 241]|nr:hypothetical protein FOA52_007957 [Chlamydomonas sp. UWO 241]
MAADMSLAVMRSVHSVVTASSGSFLQSADTLRRGLPVPSAANAWANHRHQSMPRAATTSAAAELHHHALFSSSESMHLPTRYSPTRYYLPVPPAEPGAVPPLASPLQPDGTEGKRLTALELYEGPSDEATQEKVGLLTLIPYNRPELPYAVLGVLGATVVGGTQPAMAILFSTIITLYYGAEESYAKSRTSFICWMFFVLAVGVLASSVLMHWAFGTMGAALAVRLRVLLLSSILSQEIGWFDFQAHSSGVLVSILSTDCSYVRGAVGDVLGVLAEYSAALVLGIVIGLVFDWRYALVVIGCIPILLIGGAMYQAVLFGSGKAKADSADDVASGCIGSVRVVASYGLEAYMEWWYETELAVSVGAGKRTALISGLWLSYSQLALYLVMAFVVWFAGNEVSSGRDSSDDVLKCLLTIIFAVTGVAQAQMDFPYLAKASGAVQRIFPILRRQPKVDVTIGSPGSSPLEGHIEFDAVNFAYPTRPDALVFSGFCLDMPAGKMTALVGESGSGKSTVVALILRFYEPLRGCVRLDGRDLSGMQLAWVRSQFALVQQEPLLFAATVAENIRYSRPGATLEEVVGAATAANAHCFVSELPQGYDTYIGPRGIQLSGGQKQRIAIARAVLRAPAVMLLDEATSALDAVSEREVQVALDRVLSGRTSVVVAHKLLTVQGAAQIAVVHNGRVVELGSHLDLVGIHDGIYSRLAAAQTSQF